MQPTFDIEEYMASKAEAVDRALDLAVPVQSPKKLHEMVRSVLLADNQERLYSTVSIAACELFGGEQETVMPIACAMEMIYISSVAHAEYTNAYERIFRSGSSTQPGTGGQLMAILARDALASKVFEHIAKETKGVSSENIVRVLARVGKTLGSEGMVASHYVSLQMFQSSDDEQPNLETVEFIHLHQAALLVECSVVCGAIVGGAADDHIVSLAEYGRNLGLLIQVVDELVQVRKENEFRGDLADVELGDPLLLQGLQQDSFLRVLGFRKTKQYADELLRRARMQISHFDPRRAAPLLAIAASVFDNSHEPI